MTTKQEILEGLVMALEEQLNEHFATWMAARADVEGAETSRILFEKEPSVIRARAALQSAKAGGE